MMGYAGLNEEGHLELDGYDCVDLAREFDTPLFVISESRIRSNYREYRDAFEASWPKVLVAFSSKSNLDLAFLRVLAKEGGGVEAFGRYELQIALLAGFEHDKIIFNGINRTKEDFKTAIDSGVSIHVDSPLELEYLDDLSRQRGLVTDVSLRIVPTLHALDEKSMTDHRFSPPKISLGAWVRAMQFGMDLETAYLAFKRSRDLENIRINGLMMHCANARRGGYLTPEIVEAFDFAARLKRDFSFEFEVFDIGGAFIPVESLFEGQKLRWPETISTNPVSEDARVIAESMKEKCEEHQFEAPLLVLEPGRGLSHNTELLLARVGQIKPLYGRTYAFLDADTNSLHPMLHEYHEIVVANKGDLPKEVSVDFRGSTCTAAESNLAGGGTRTCPKLQTGDVVAILDTGAYAESYFGNMNAIPKPATVMLGERGASVIRERETLQDVLAHQSIPSWLL